MSETAGGGGNAPAMWQMIQMIWGTMPVQAISVAAKLGIADLLADGPRTVEDLAQATKTHAATLGRLLRALAGLSIFIEDRAGRFANTPLSETLRTDRPASLAALARIWGTRLWLEPWDHLSESIATGDPAFNRVFQEPFFEYLSHHAEDASLFNAAMTGSSALSMSAVLAAYDFSRFQHIVDVGGGAGALLQGILAATPDARGVLYDLPEVVAGAEGLRTGALAGRCDVVSGSFFESIPTGGDAYVLQRIIHDWDDASALRILENCHRAMGAGSTLLLIDWVLKPPNEPDLGKFMDLHMLVLLGGRERTAPEFEALLRKAGFSLTQVIETPGPHAIVEATPLE